MSIKITKYNMSTADMAKHNLNTYYESYFSRMFLHSLARSKGCASIRTVRPEKFNLGKCSRSEFDSGQSKSTCFSVCTDPHVHSLSVSGMRDQARIQGGGGPWGPWPPPLGRFFFKKKKKKLKN